MPKSSFLFHIYQVFHFSVAEVDYELSEKHIDMNPTFLRGLLTIVHD